MCYLSGRMRVRGGVGDCVRRRFSVTPCVPLGIMLKYHRAVGAQGMTAVKLERTHVRIAVLASAVSHGLHCHGRKHLGQFGHVGTAGGIAEALFDLAPE